MKSHSYWLVLGAPIVSKQHYHHRFCLPIACTLVYWLLQPMQLATEVHSQFSTILGDWSGIVMILITEVLILLLITLCFVRCVGPVLQNLSFLSLNIAKLYMEHKFQLVWGLAWCLKPKNLGNAGNVLTLLKLLHSCLRSFNILGNVYDFHFSVGIWVP